jgi:hypothetical protein
LEILPSIPKTMTIHVRVGRQRNGTTYELAPESRAALAKRASTELPSASSVFISHETQDHVELTYGPVWKHVVGILTGLTTDEIEEVDRIIFEDPQTSDTLFTPQTMDVKTG